MLNKPIHKYIKDCILSVVITYHTLHFCSETSHRTQSTLRGYLLQNLHCFVIAKYSEQETTVNR